jgi:hypothetical protein
LFSLLALLGLVHVPRLPWHVESLGPELAGEFRTRMFAGLERVHSDGGITVDRTVAFTRMRKA